MRRFINATFAGMVFVIITELVFGFIAGLYLLYAWLVRNNISDGVVIMIYGGILAFIVGFILCLGGDDNK